MQRCFSHLLVACTALLGASFAGAADAPGGIRVTDVWSRATAPGAPMGAAYFVLTNHGDPDRLIRARAPIAKRTELHTTKHEGGMMRMEPLDGVDVGRGESVTFAPGGRHVMFIGLERRLREGDTFPLTLTFEKAGDIEVTVHVRGAAGTPKAAH